MTNLREEQPIAGQRKYLDGLLHDVIKLQGFVETNDPALAAHRRGHAGAARVDWPRASAGAGLGRRRAFAPRVVAGVTSMPYRSPEEEALERQRELQAKIAQAEQDLRTLAARFEDGRQPAFDAIHDRPDWRAVGFGILIGYAARRFMPCCR